MTKSDFDNIANKYDSWYENPVGQTYDRIQKREIAYALESVSDGKKMLEVGCGTGHWTAFFANKGFDVTGVDISSKMLQVASSKGIRSARYTLVDCRNLPFDRNTFDVACAITALEFMSDARTALAEIARCVRPGGKVVVGVLNRVSLLAWLRRRRGSTTFAKAHLMSNKEVRRLLKTVGDATVNSSAFVLPWRGLLWLSRVLDAVGRFLRLPFGDFIVGTVRIQSS